MNVVYNHLSEARLERLSHELEERREVAFGLLMAFWLRSQEALLVEGDYDELAAHMHSTDPLTQRHFLAALQRSGYVNETSDGIFYVLDNAAVVGIRKMRWMASVKGIAARTAKREERKNAQASPPSRVRKRRSAQVVSEEQVANSFTWSAYANAYAMRYQTTPTRNAKVNKQVSQFVQRVGQEDAPRIVEYYLTINTPLYVRSWHSFDLALRDAETLRSQWKTKSFATDVDVAYQSRQADYVAEMRNIEREHARPSTRDDTDLYSNAIIP